MTITVNATLISIPLILRLKLPGTSLGAFKKVPKEVQDKTLDDIKQKLKGRRANLQNIATRYYNYLNELVVLTQQMSITKG